MHVHVKMSILGHVQRRESVSVTTQEENALTHKQACAIALTCKKHKHVIAQTR